ncbi:VOC family protein [Bosea sp. 117]|uniref:VOC family protein n=1 Tax=Bosea sp. 117 TaxID=1125973 RepID=UPI000494D506|nr:VOC family protein [Bosea sp. 117]
MSPVASQIFVNLPVKDLKASVDFFTALGFTFNPQFTDENATCMIIGENIYAMLLVEPFFEGFSKTPIPDPRKGHEVLIALQVESNAKVDELIAKALAAGGTAPRAAQDHGFMYSHGFDDLDGHVWEIFHMSQMPPAA